DRLLMPDLDRNAPVLDLSSDHVNANGILPLNLGALSALSWQRADADNVGQDIAMYLVNALTRNHYPEVIGYPDPLHKADWGAKTLGDQLRRTIRSSEVSFAARPLSRTFRAIRDSYGRR